MLMSIFITAILAWTISSEKVFEPARLKFLRLKVGKFADFRDFVYAGLTCPFCLGMWLSPFAVFLVFGAIEPKVWFVSVVITGGGAGAITTIYSIARQLFKIFYFVAMRLQLEVSRLESMTRTNPPRKNASPQERIRATLR